MSESTSQPRRTDDDQSSLDHHFVRNRFFNGKLMTARDMAAEQDYHAGRLETLTRYVTGAGIVCGLGLGVEASDGDDPPRVKVDSGLAIDGFGRPIVVHDEETRPITGEDRDPTETVAVYLSATTCLTESVPAHGSEDACEDNCEYNRVRETFAIDLDDDPPGTPKSLGVEDSAHPTESTVTDAAMAEQGPADDNTALHAFARSYHESDDWLVGGRDCGSSAPERVFLGQLERDSEGTWSAVEPDDEAFEPRPYVYTNDLLYTGLVDHATDFANPHELALDVGTTDGGATVDLDDGNSVSIVGSDGTTVAVDDGDITVSSKPQANTDLSVSPIDGGASVAVGDGDPIDLLGGENTTVDPAGDSITVSSTGGLEELDPLAEYCLDGRFRRDVLDNLACALEALADRTELDRTETSPLAYKIAMTIHDVTGEDGEILDDPDAFVEFTVEELQDSLHQLPEVLGDYVGGQVRLERCLEIADDDPLSVALWLRRVGMAVECLSGTAVRFDQFDPPTAVTSPLTVRSAVFEPHLPEVPMLWGLVPRIVTVDEERKALEFLQRGLRIEVEPTEYASVTVRNGQWIGLTGSAADGTEIGRESASPDQGATVDLTVRSEPGAPPISYLDVQIDGGAAPSEPEAFEAAVERLSDQQASILREQMNQQTAQVLALRVR